MPFPDYSAKELRQMRENKSRLEEIEKDQAMKDIFDSIFIEEKTDYENIKFLRSIGGELVFCAKKNERYFIVHKGKEGKKYSSLIKPMDVDGRLYYFKTDGNNIIVFYDGKETVYDGTIYSIEDPWRPVEINGRIAFWGKKGDRNIILLDGEEIGGEYDWVGQPRNINGKLAFPVRQGTRQKGEYFTIYENGKRQEADPSIRSNIIEINGKIPYIEKKENKEFVVCGDIKGKEYEKIEEPLVEINGKLAYIAEARGRIYVVYDGKEIGKYIARVRRPRYLKNIDGKPSYIVGKKLGSRLISVFDGKEIEFQDGSSYCPHLINDKLCYWGQLSYLWGFAWVCVYDDKRIRVYDTIEKPVIIDSKQVLAGYRDNAWFIIKEK